LLDVTATDLENDLETERAKSENLSSEVQNLQKQISEALSRAELSEAKEKELVVYYRQQVYPYFVVTLVSLTICAGTPAENRLFLGL